MTIWDKLSEPFPPEDIRWRVGATNQDKTKGMALAYIDARDVMNRLDKVCGPNNWQSKYTEVNSAVCCSIGIYDRDSPIIGTWVWKSDGAGQTSYEGDKGQFSDAFKRAAVQHGIGRYLYDVGTPWVAIEPHGKSYKFTSMALANLERSLTSKRAPSISRKDAGPDVEIKSAFLDLLWLTKTYAEAMEVSDKFKPEFALMKREGSEILPELRAEFAKQIKPFKDRPTA